MLVEHRTRDVVVSIDDYRRSMKLQRASPHRLFVGGAAGRTALRILLRRGLRVRARAGCERVRDRNKQNRRYGWTEIDHLRNVSPVWVTSLFVMRSLSVIRRTAAAGDYFAV